MQPNLITELFSTVRGVLVEAESVPVPFPSAQQTFLPPAVVVWAARSLVTCQGVCERSCVFSIYLFIFPSLQVKDDLRYCSSRCVSMI